MRGITILVSLLGLILTSCDPNHSPPQCTASANHDWDTWKVIPTEEPYYDRVVTQQRTCKGCGYAQTLAFSPTSSRPKD